MVRMRLGRWVVGAAAGIAFQAAAQEPTRPAPIHYTLSALITDSEGAPVADADILVSQDSAAPRSFRSNAEGRWQVGDLVSSRVTLRVRRLGYRARIVPVRIGAVDHRASVVVALETAVAKLQGMSILETEDEPDARLRDFNARRQTNSFGRYIEQETIEKKRPQWLSEVLRPVPGVTVQSSRRIGNTVRLRGCMPLLWVDAVRMPGAELDEVVQPSDVAAMEIYNSFAGIPAQFFDRSATCGTILVWTRAR